MGEGFLVAALAGQGIVNIGQGRYLCSNGNIIAAQPIGVAFAVPALVVPAADFNGIFDQCFVLIKRQAGNKLRADGGVLLDNFKFLRG